MTKRVISCIVAIVMVFSVVSISVPLNIVYAADTIWLEVTKDNAPVRAEKANDGKVLRKLPKGTIITAEKKELNWKFRWWYKLKNGEYIYSGNVKETHEHKVVIAYYEKQHPHYAIHECKHCKIGGSCGPETQKMKGCEKCYPTSTESKKENTNKVPNTNVTTNSDILAPTRPSLQEEAEKNLGTPTHSHNYKFSYYEAGHPHYPVYKCSCNDSYRDVAKTQKQLGCATCFPHEHSYTFAGYNSVHPHNAIYKCSCNATYADSKTSVVKTCTQCYPYGYGNDHFCNMVYTGKNLKEHPHYAIEKCSICDKQKINQDSTKRSSECSICNNPFNDKVENIPDFHGRIYDLSTGEIINIKESDALYDYANDLHASFMVLGLFPVYGEVFDIADAAFYIVEGEYVDAVIAGACTFPIIGVLARNGKIHKKAAKVTVDLATNTTKTIAEELSEELLKKELKNITPVAKNIILNHNTGSEATLKIIKEITENKSIKLSEAYYNGQLLFSRNYMGSVTTKTGMKYAYNTYENKNAIYHIIDKHGYSQAKNKVKGVTYFNIDGREIMELVEDVYQNSNSIKTKVVTDKGKTTRTSHIIDAGRIIGTEGEDKLLLILEGDSIISAYPTKHTDFTN